MALFKIEKGLAANLTKNRPNAVEGYCYFTSDDGKFYIDIATGTAKTPSENGGKLAGVTRMPINSYLSDWTARAYADKDGNDFHYNDSSWCASNILDRLEERSNFRCLCDVASFEYLRDATEEDEEKWGVVKVNELEE